MDGVCESMLAGILTPAAFLHQRDWPVMTRCLEDTTCSNHAQILKKFKEMEKDQTMDEN